MFRSIGVTVAAATVLAGCAASDVVRDEPPPGYIADPAARTAAVDWSRAETVGVRLAEYEIAPETLRFRAGEPYRLRLANAGGNTHTFVSRGFFQSIAAARLGGDGAARQAPYVETIALAPGATRALDFVAVTPGTYRVECTVPGHAFFGMVGEIVIE